MGYLFVCVAFEQDSEVGGVSEVRGDVGGRKSLKTSGSSSSVDYSGTVTKTTTTPMSPKRKISGSIKRIIKWVWPMNG